MKFLFLIHGDTDAEAALTADERRAIVSEPIVTDGPFAETKEGVGGFYVVECASREDALELAGHVPQSPGVAVEVLTIAAV